MKIILKLFVFTIFLGSPALVFGQSQNEELESSSKAGDTTVADTFPTLAELYYGQTMDVDRGYEYDLLNKKIMYYWVGIGVGVAGTLCGLYVALIPVMMGCDWPTWGLLSYSLGTMGAIMAPSYYLLIHYIKKASAIDVRFLAQVPVNDRLSVGAVSLTYLPNSNNRAFGMGFTLKF